MSQPENPEILIRVAPRMLSDVLSVALRQHGLAVVSCPIPERRLAPREVRHFDLAVVTDDLPADARAETVIRIDEAGTPVTRNDRPIVDDCGEQGLPRLLRELRRDRADDSAVCEPS